MRKAKSLFLRLFILAMMFVPTARVFAIDPTPDPNTGDVTYYSYDQFRNGYSSWRGAGTFKNIVSLGWKGSAIFLAGDVFSAAMAYLISIMQMGYISDPNKRAEAKSKLLNQIITIALLGATPAVIMIFTVIMQTMA